MSEFGFEVGMRTDMKFGFNRQTLTQFSPSDISGLSLWFDATDSSTINSSIAADFIAANSESLSSASSAFNKGDEDFSFGAWIWMDVNTGGAAYTFMGKFNTTGNQRSYGLSKQGGTNSIIFPISSDGINTTVLDSGVNLTINTWNFVVGVYDSVNDLVKISVNNANFVTAAHSGGAYAAATPDFYLGQYGTGGNYLDGRMQGAFFYSKALSQAEVTSLYNSGNGMLYDDLSGSLLTSLTAFWDLTELSGNRADNSGNGYTLTDNNTVLYSGGKVTYPIVNGANVYNWMDKSTNDYDVTQSTGISMPVYNSTGFGVNSKPYVYFDGIDDFLTIVVGANFASTTSGTVFICIQNSANDVAGESLYVLSYSLSTAARYTSFGSDYISADVNRSRFATSYTTIRIFTGTTTNILNNGFSINTIQSTGSDYVCRTNGVNQTISYSTATAPLGSWIALPPGINRVSMGARLINSANIYSKFKVMEVLNYDAVLTTEQMQQVETYLNNKAGGIL